MKTCLKCQQTKLFSAYGKNRSKKDGVQTYCKECNREYYYNGHWPVTPKPLICNDSFLNFFEEST